MARLPLVPRARPREVGRVNDGTCIPCPDAIACNQPGSVLVAAKVKQGYWRADNQSRTFYVCRVPEACVGASGLRSSGNFTTNTTTNTADQFCAPGQTGPLCAVCKPGFSRWSSKSLCTPCPKDLAGGIVASVFSFLGILVLLVACLMFNRRAPNGILRPLINAAQMMMVVLMFPVDWPKSITVMSRIFDGINFDFVSVASPTCMGMPLNFYWRFAVMTILTLLVVAMPWCVSWINHLRRRNAEKWAGAIKARLRDTFLLVVLLHPTISGLAFYHFRCETVAGTSYLMADYSLICTESAWYSMLAPVLLVIVLFAFGMPLLFAGLLWRRRHELDDPKTKRMLGMLYSSFKPDLYYFESILMLFKLGLWATLVFFENGSQFQLATSALLCVLQLCVHARYEPYDDRIKNTLQYLGLILVAVTSFSGLVLNYLKTAKELAHERQDLPKKANMEANIVIVQTIAEVVLWLGIALVVVRVIIAVAKFGHKHKDRIREVASRPVNSFMGRRSRLSAGSRNSSSSASSSAAVCASGGVELAEVRRPDSVSLEPEEVGGREHKDDDDRAWTLNPTLSEKQAWSGRPEDRDS